MARILIIYESRYGQTEKISKFILDRLQSKGHSVDFVNLSKNQLVDPANYDGVIAGAGIYGSRYPRAVRTWAKKYSQYLNRKPSAFFSVCLAVLQQKNEKAQKEIKKLEEGFFTKTSWFPKTHNIFAGALSYSKYNWFMKQVMRLISRSGGGETDVSRDYEYTNWNDVGRFADDFMNLLTVKLERGEGLFP